MNQPHVSDVGDPEPSDDQGNAQQNDESLELADGGRSEMIARLRERFSFSG